MATPPNSPPSPLPTNATSHSPSTLKRTRKAIRLRSLATRPVGTKRPLVHDKIISHVHLSLAVIYI